MVNNHLYLAVTAVCVCSDKQAVHSKFIATLMDAD